jgi:hypothetical protein
MSCAYGPRFVVRCESRIIAYGRSWGGRGRKVWVPYHPRGGDGRGEEWGGRGKEEGKKGEEMGRRGKEEGKKGEEKGQKGARWGRKEQKEGQEEGLERAGTGKGGLSVLRSLLPGLSGG